MNRLRIGMTGGIGTGKTAAAAAFAELGFYVIDADILAKKASEPSGAAYKEIVGAFGREILTPSGEIDRKALGKAVFSDTEKRRLLESIVHPAVWELEKKERGRILGRDAGALIITSAALLVETGAYKNYNPLITVHCSPENQLRRVKARDGITEEEAVMRINAQLPSEEKLKAAGIIINNDGDEAALKEEVRRAAALIRQIDYALRHRK